MAIKTYGILQVDVLCALISLFQDSGHVQMLPFAVILK